MGPPNTDRPFREIVVEQLEERGWSRRELARRCDSEQGWGSAVTVLAITNGSYPATLRSMEVISAVLREKPERFAEFRMARLREDLNPAHVGYDRALKTLRRLER